jgi:hypothetical protein
MVKAVLAVIGGYLVMFVVVFASFSAAFLAMGADGAFKAGTYEVSGSWIALTVVVGLVAALLGGLFCAKIAPGGRAPIALAIVVLVLGFASALPVLMASSEPVAERAGTVGNVEAMNNARQPVWIALLNPLIGAVGVMLGARIASRSEEPGTS